MVEIVYPFYEPHRGAWNRETWSSPRTLPDHGIIGLANVLGFTVRGLPPDGEGVTPDAFDAAGRAAKVTALVLIPTFNNPTTTLMGAERRRAIADVARRPGGVQTAPRRPAARDRGDDPGPRLVPSRY